MSYRNGLTITVAGAPISGKSTVAYLIAEKLSEFGITAEIVDEPHRHGAPRTVLEYDNTYDPPRAERIATALSGRRIVIETRQKPWPERRADWRAEMKRRYPELYDHSGSMSVMRKMDPEDPAKVLDLLTDEQLSVVYDRLRDLKDLGDLENHELARFRVLEAEYLKRSYSS